MKRYFVYIMSNKSRRLYTGITSNLAKRVLQHRHKLMEGRPTESKVAKTACACRAVACILMGLTDIRPQQTL
ncbi:MAG TPA: GIY-YIG nuclease family protein [Candidatus Angelobacter sp.]|nr:GIY-YIG nuclease family protein [Candidatus Angelobacter sp.]